MPQKFEIRAASSGAELLIFGNIGDDPFGGQSTDAKTVIEQLAQLTGPLAVHINSYGGSVADGLAIYNAIQRYPANVTVHIDGVAVSIASMIAMAGNRLEMPENALLMIHAPWGGAVGNAKAMRDYADTLDTYAKAMASAYANKSGKTTDEIMQLLSDGEDHWYTAQEALAAGFADTITEPVAIAAHGLKASRFASSMPSLNATGEKTMPKPKHPASPTEDEVLARERERRTDIRNIYSPFIQRDGVQALLDNILDNPKVTVEQAREQLLVHLGKDSEPLARQPVITYGQNAHHGDFFAAAVDSILQRNGIKLTDPHPAARDVRNLSADQIAARLLEQRGKSTALMSRQDVVAAAMTSSDFPQLLANTANKALMVGYENEPASHRQWVREVEVADFKDVKRAAISEAPALLKIPEGGEYHHGTLDERAENYRLETFGRILTISRQAIINDDLEALTRIPMAFGASAARLEADQVYAILTSNPAMSDGVALFDASHNNLLAGAPLSVDSLGVARAAMRRQKGLKGEGVLNLVPRYLIVPAELETAAEQLIASLVDPSKANDTQNPNWIRNLELVVDSRLDESSTTAWFLAASTTQIDTVEVAHLEGQRGVFTEESTDFETDALKVKARLDFAAAAIDWVGLTMNPGA